MARIGENPFKKIRSADGISTVLAATIVCIPQMSGYWSNSLEITKMSMQSMRDTARMPITTLVYDNGSCVEVEEYLRAEQYAGRIDILIRSARNIGKVGAWNVIFGCGISDYVAYYDSDVLFLPGWLEKSLQIMQTYDKAGMVTAQPIYGYDMNMTKNTIRIKEEEGIIITEGVLIPEEYARSCIAGLGGDESLFRERNLYRNDVLIEKNGVSAYTTASHFQFLTRSHVARALFPATSDVLLGGDLQFDDALVERGWWRLSTKDYYVHHLGNRVTNLHDELPWCQKEQLPDMSIYKQGKGARRSAAVNNRHLRKLIQAVANGAYRLLHG